MYIQRKSLIIFRIFADYSTLIFSFLLAVWWQLFEFRIRMLTNSEGYTLIFLFFIWYFSARANGLYDEFRSRDFSFEFSAILKSLLSLTIAAISFLFFLQLNFHVRSFILIFILLFMVTITIERYIFRKILESNRKRGRNLRSLLIIGAGELGKGFFDTISNNIHFGYKVLGFLDDEEKPYLNGEYLGKIDELDFVLYNNKVDDVIIALPNYAAEKLDEVMRICENHTTRVKIIPDYFKFSASKFEVTMFGKYPVISVRREPINELHWRIIKRFFDFTFSLLLLITFLWWFGGIIAILIKFTSKGPVLFKQERWGKNNKKFLALKFRSMVCNSLDTDENGKYQQASKDDPRVTNIGRFLRKTNLDELPQFLNVLMGDMSVVGPRPHPIPLNLESRNKVERYMLRTLVKPGITGWAQVNGYRGETKQTHHMQKRVDYDLWYIENWTFILDLQIIAMTIWNMLKGDPNAY